jgi:hypothetical protein
MWKKNVMPGQVHRAASLLVFVPLAAYCIIGAAVVIFGSARFLHNPWENMYTESPQTYAAISAAQTGRLYIPMSQPPYTLQVYTPLYYAINTSVARIAHLEVDRFVFYARLISYLAFLLCGAMVFLISRSASASTLFCVLAALMMLGQPAFLCWNITPRPDMLYLLAMLLSLFCVLRWEDHLWRGYALSGALAGIAFLIKQPGLAVAAAVFAVLIPQKKFKAAAVLTASTIAPIAVTFCILYWRRDPFFQQVTFAAKSRWSLSDAAHFLSSDYFAPCLIVPFFLGAMGFVRAMRLDGKAKMIAAFALLNIVTGLLGLAQVGGNLNYLLPGLAGCALLLPYAGQWMPSPARVTAPMVIACVALLWATSTAYTREAAILRYLNLASEASLTWLRPFRILSDAPTLNLHGRQPILLDPFGAHVLELTGSWDATPVIESLQREEFDLIIFTHGNNLRIVPSYRGVSFFGPAEVKIINAKYEVLCSTASSLVLKPRGRDVAATPEMFDRLFNKPCSVAERVFPMDLKLAPNAQ